MAKGGRYLAKNQKNAPGGKKKGRGWKIALIVLAVLLILFGILYFLASSYLNNMLNLINRAEIEDKGTSVEDILKAAQFNPDRGSEETVPPTAARTEPIPSETTMETAGD